MSFPVHPGHETFLEKFRVEVDLAILDRKFPRDSKKLSQLRKMPKWHCTFFHCPSHPTGDLYFEVHETRQDVHERSKFDIDWFL